jgi:hypothetical protein
MDRVYDKPSFRDRRDAASNRGGRSTRWMYVLAVSFFLSGSWLRAELIGTEVNSSTPAPAESSSDSGLPKVKVGGLWYLSYQNGTASGEDFSRFVIKRGYINIEAKINSFLSARITPDVVQREDPGDVEVRLKYAYAKFSATRNVGFITKPELEFGIVHMPWLDFEEHVNLYRMQDTMFMERLSLFNSADIGFTGTALLGGTMPEDYQKKVSSHYPGRYGSFAFGIYNGGGYHATEVNYDKAIEGRVTIRPLPDQLPGFQFSYFGLNGQGNVEEEGPDWRVNAIMASYQHERVVLTAQWMTATGNQKGGAVKPSGEAVDSSGWSVFAEAKLTPDWSLIGRLDSYDPDESVSENNGKRYIAGVCYHLGGGNDLLLDYDRVEFEQPGRSPDDRIQFTVQIKF